MGFADRQAEAVLGPRGQDEVNVIGHQAIGPYRHLAPARLAGQEVAINRLIARLEEDRPAPVAPLGDVVGAAGRHDASLTGHEVNDRPPQAKGKIYHVPFLRHIGPAPAGAGEHIAFEGRVGMQGAVRPGVGLGLPLRLARARRLLSPRRRHTRIARSLAWAADLGFECRHPRDQHLDARQQRRNQRVLVDQIRRRSHP